MWQEYAANQYTYKFKGLITQLRNGLVEPGSTLSYIPIALVTISIFCGASWLIFWTQTDPARYQCYALTFWFGSHATMLLPAAQCAFLHISQPQPPLHMLPTEYPPLTLVPFSLALLGPLAYYQFIFAMLMSLISVLIYWKLLHHGPRGAALVFTIYLFIGAIATATARFDLIPAALTLACVIAAEQKRWTTAYIMLAFGTLMKLYPVLLLPALFLAEQQDQGRLHIPPKLLTMQPVLQEVLSTLTGVSNWQWKNCLIFLGIIGGITGVFACLNFQGAVLSQLDFFVKRPVQIETTQSTLFWLAKGLGFPLQIVYSYGSINGLSNLSRLISPISTGLFIAAFAYILWLQWRQKIDFAQASIALLLLFIMTGKVFSPQYLIWLMPLLAYAGAFDPFWFLTWGTISLLTSYVYMFLYARVSSLHVDSLTAIPGFFEIVAVRNALFVFVTLAYLFDWFHARQRKPLPLPQDG